MWLANQSGTCYVKVNNTAMQYGLQATYDLSVHEYTPTPDLTISKGSTGLLRGGGLARYTLVFTNSGTVVAGNVIVTDRLPAELLYSSDTGGGAPDATGRVVVWHLGAGPEGAR